MTISSYTHQEFRDARKAGFRRKKPKLNTKGGYNAVNARVERYNAWVRDLKDAAKRGKQLESVKDQIRKHRK